jgi:UDP-glucose 4-epimerase
MRSLVTGAAGFMGSHVARHCLALGHDVVGVDDLSGGFLENIPEGVDFKEGSVMDAAFVTDLFATTHFDYVYHLAAYAAEGLSHFIRSFNYQNNLLATINLTNEAVKTGVDCFVFTSSIAVYGAGQLPMTEEQTPIPEDPYGISKYAAELDLRAAHEMFGLDSVVFRPHNVYGENQNIGDRYRNVIGIFINQIMTGNPMTIFGDGHQTRAFSHIDDVAPLISQSVNMMEARNETFNIGADEPREVLEVAQLVAAAFGVEPDINYLPARNEVIHAYSSHEKANRIFETEKTIRLEEGVARMVSWACEHGPRSTQPFSGVEVSKNMPPSWAEWLSDASTDAS